MPRPCPFASCRYSLRVDVVRAGRASSNRLLVYKEGLQESEELVAFAAEDGVSYHPVDVPADQSCALDVADEGSHTMEEVGDALGVSKQRAEQIENKAIEQFRRAAARMGVDLRELIGRSSSVVPGESEDHGHDNDVIPALAGVESRLPKYEARSVAVTVDGRRVGDVDEAPGGRRRVGNRFSLYRHWQKKRGATGV